MYFIHTGEKKPQQNTSQNEDTMQNFGVAWTAHKYAKSMVLASAGPKWMKLRGHGI